jgi:hypothetical protein
MSIVHDRVICTYTSSSKPPNQYLVPNQSLPRGLKCSVTLRPMYIATLFMKDERVVFIPKSFLFWDTHRQTPLEHHWGPYYQRVQAGTTLQNSIGIHPSNTTTLKTYRQGCFLRYLEGFSRLGHLSSLRSWCCINAHILARVRPWEASPMIHFTFGCLSCPPLGLRRHSNACVTNWLNKVWVNGPVQDRPLYQWNNQNNKTCQRPIATDTNPRVPPGV